MDPLTAMLCERLDYWHPLRFVNLSGACATTKLLQLRMHGLDNLSIARKLAMDDTHDLNPCELINRRALDKLVQTQCPADGAGPVFVPLLYNWELYTGDASDEGHFGNMIWVDTTLTRFLTCELFGTTPCKTGRARLSADSTS